MIRVPLVGTVSAAIGARVNRTPIRLRLALTFAGVMVVLFGVLFLLLYVRFAAGLDDSITSSLESRAADLSAVASSGNKQLDRHPVLPQRSSGFAQIVDPDGHVLAYTPGVAQRPLLTPSELIRVRSGPIDLDENGQVRLRASRVGPSSPNVVVVGVSLADRNSALSALQKLLFVGGPIALLIACAAGYTVAAKALAPVERMRKRAARMSRFESHERLPVPPSRDEIQRLGETLNGMLARVEEVLERGRAFVAGASHELRTPLTILQLELDDALTGDYSREDLQAAINSAREEVQRLTSLTEELLVIAQSDQRRLPLNRERFEVHEVMRAIAQRYAHLDELVGREVTVRPNGALFLEADIHRIDQALSNMINNALRFGEGRVELRANERGGNIELHVVDQGPGFPPEFLPRAFERFSRADPARSRGATGLGLAITRAIAEAHQGRAMAENRPGGGAHVWLTLPASAVPGAAGTGASALGEQAEQVL
jgi:signal transduction histidine kinase